MFSDSKKWLDFGNFLNKNLTVYEKGSFRDHLKNRKTCNISISL